MTNPTKPAYAGEAQLIRWADSLSAGRTLTLRLDEEGDLHPFKGIPAGQRMQIAVVLVNDDEEMIDPDKAKANATRHKARPRAEKAEPAAPSVKAETKRSSRAHLKCNDPEFQKWMRSRYQPQCEVIDYGEGTEFAWCDMLLKETLDIESKSELDKNPDKAEAWDRLLTSYDNRHLVRE